MQDLPDLRHARDHRKRARTLAHRRTPHAIANLRRVHIQLGERAAQRIAMHAKLFGSLALIALVVGQNFKDVAPLELPNSLRV